VRTRRSGPFYFADIEIEIPSSETVKSLAELTHKLESTLRNTIPQLDSVMISVEPVIKTQYIVVIAVSSLDSTLDDPPADHFGMAPAFLFVKIDCPTRTKISTRIIENPHRLAERKRGILAAKLLTENKLDILAIKDLKNFGLGPKAVLTENNVELFQYQGNSIQEILSEISRSQSEK
jgi:predicted Fe-Mo cluster-binding NifX family protein